MLLTYMFAMLLCVCTVYGGNGTTPNIEQIFLGRCFEYTELSVGRLTSVTVNCTQLWSLFKSSWAYKDPVFVTRTEYQQFFKAAAIQTYPANKTLLWSGTYDIAHEYSNRGRRYITLEDSLIGYIVNGLTWCGKVCANCDGINYEICPDWSNLPREVNEAFWGGLSETFARSAKGEIRLVLSGTNPNRPAYSQNSYFSKFELNALPKNCTVIVILVNDVDKKPIEHCGQGTLLELQQEVQKKGLGYTCVENPNDILHLMCVDNASSDKCAFQRKQTQGYPWSAHQKMLLG